MFPFIHRPTFDPTTAPEHLIVAMLCVSLQYLDNEGHGRQAATSCFVRGQKLVDELDRVMGPGLDLTVIQAMIMLGTHAIMVQGGAQSWTGLRMHAKCIEVSALALIADERSREDAGCPSHFLRPANRRQT